MNLPVDDLKKSEGSKGAVIAVSFKNKPQSESGRNLVTYTQQLFSAAIQSGVIWSEYFFGRENVCQLDTDINTFEFERALGEGLELHYRLAKMQFASWIEEWLKPRKKSKAPRRHRFLYPSLSNVPISPAILREIDDRLKSEPPTKANAVYSVRNCHS